MDKHYLIFERHAHSVVFFVRAQNPTEAVWRFISGESRDAVRQADGSVFLDTDLGPRRYAHPLSYIEAMYKTDGEWQIREMPDWCWQEDYSEIFCGESADGAPEVIAECRPVFEVECPGAEAEAFVWYLKKGSLVTFYRRGIYQIEVLMRYVLDWDGKSATVRGWSGDHEHLMSELSLVPRRPGG